MDQLVVICLSGICLLTPFIVIALSGGVYLAGMGSVKIPGVARTTKGAGDWTTVPELTRRVSDGFAALISMIGVFFALVGFLLPWLQAQASIGGFGGSGSINGLAIGFQGLVAGSQLLGVSSAAGTGIALILMALFTWGILLFTLVCGALGAGLISVPIGVFKFNAQRLGGLLAVTAVLGLCLACVLFGTVQATIGGASGSAGGFGVSGSASAGVGSGFWSTFGGLALTLVGALIAAVGSSRLSAWAQRLGDLDAVKK